jgi:hypothetical protein
MKQLISNLTPWTIETICFVLFVVMTFIPVLKAMLRKVKFQTVVTQGTFMKNGGAKGYASCKSMSNIEKNEMLL